MVQIKQISFTRKRINIIDTFYYIDDTRIQKTDYTKDLGITFESNLNFKKHLNNISNQSIYRIAIEFYHPSIMKKLINIYVRPILEYGAVI